MSMWKFDLDSISWRDGILVWDGNPYQTCMAVNRSGQLLVGFECLTYFATYGCPYEDIHQLYDILYAADPDGVERITYNSLDDPMFMVQDIFRDNLNI